MYPYFSLIEEIATSTSPTVDDDHRSIHLDHDSKDSLRKSVESLFNKLYGMCKFLIHYPIAIKYYLTYNYYLGISHALKCNHSFIKNILMIKLVIKLFHYMCVHTYINKENYWHFVKPYYTTHSAVKQ